MSRGPTGYWKQSAVPAGVLAIGLALRLLHLGSWGFEQDELYTLHDSSNLAWSRDGAPGIAARPVYYLVQRVLLEVLPVSEWTLRLLPFFFGVFGIWITMRLAREHFGPTASWVAGLLVAFAPWHIYASQMARYWSLVYLLSGIALLLLHRAFEQGTIRAYLGVLGVFVLGGLTHPTFAFPLVGTVLAMHIVSTGGTLTWQRPTRNALAGLWIPLVLIAFGIAAVLEATGMTRAYSNNESRGILATLRLVPAMVQWLTPEVATAFIISAVLLWVGKQGSDRRWAGTAIMGTLGAGVLLVVASFRTGVYADYGISILPLVFVTIAGLAARLATNIEGAVGSIVPVGGAALMISAMLPGVVSHHSDGSRHDYRSSLRYIQEHGPDELVVGWPIVVQRYYAPDLHMVERWAVETPSPAAGQWFLVSYQRSRILKEPPGLREFLDMRCRREHSTERPRLDYRSYRVEVFWCGKARDEKITG